MPWKNSRKVFTSAILAVAGTAALGLQACSETSSPTELRAPTASATLPLNVVFESQHSAEQNVRRVVVRDEVTWAKVWAELQGPGTTATPLPRIDFSKEMVLVATLGTKPTGGYTVALGPSYQVDTEVVALVRKEVPGRKCGTAEMVTHPFSVVSLTRTNLPVRFIESEEEKPCG